VAAGFSPVIPPVLVREEAMYGTGFFPAERFEIYEVVDEGLYLTGTSEVALAGLHMGEILDRDQLPLRYTAFSTNFRREAGAAGRDTRGLYRVHMFQKVEQVILCAADPEASLREHLLLLANSEEILQKLGLPYRVALACTAELGLGQIRKHEVESWMPSRNAYAETHSCSTLSDFQARRSNIRYQGPSSKPQFVHTLNNTAIASPRILIPILENYQQADGSVVIPEVLRPYLGGRERLVPRR
jgi:seryl-tRNA synthetase